MRGVPDHQCKRKKGERYFWVKARLFLVTFTLSCKNMVIQSQLNRSESTSFNTLSTQRNRVTKVGLLGGAKITFYILFLHLNNCTRFSFVIGRANFQCDVYLSYSYI